MGWTDPAPARSRKMASKEPPQTPKAPTRPQESASESTPRSPKPSAVPTLKPVFTDWALI